MLGISTEFATRPEKDASQHQRSGRRSLMSFTRQTATMTRACPPVLASATTPGGKMRNRPRHQRLAAPRANPPKPKPKSSNPHSDLLRTAGSCMRGFRTPPAPETLHRSGRCAGCSRVPKADFRADRPGCSVAPRAVLCTGRQRRLCGRLRLGVGKLTPQFLTFSYFKHAKVDIWRPRT
jgi:hypothetical protein